MGIEGRDYMRGGGQAPVPSSLSGLSLTTRLILVNVVLWFLYAGARSFAPGRGLDAFITDVLLLHPEEVFARFRVWQPLTALFFHDPDGIGHIFFNMLFLWVFGRPTEERIGRRALLQLYLVAGVASTLVLVLLQIVVPIGVGLGASGAVYGVGVFLALREPRMPIYFFFVRMPLWVLVGVFLVGREVLSLVLFHGAVGSTVAHLTGAAFGLLYERWHRRPRRTTARAPREQQSKEPDQARVDALLDKIHREGIGALTQDEKDVLERASTQFRSR